MIKQPSTLVEAIRPKEKAVRFAIVERSYTTTVDVIPVGGTSIKHDVPIQGMMPLVGDRVLLRTNEAGVMVAIPETSRPVVVLQNQQGGGDGTVTQVIQNITYNVTTSGDTGLYVPISRQLLNGDGISPIGDLSANRTISVDNTVVRTTRRVLNGDGLLVTNSGYLSADITLSVQVGQGLEIVSNAVRMGTPQVLSKTSTSSFSGSAHSHGITTTEVGAASTIVATNASGQVVAHQFVADLAGGATPGYITEDRDGTSQNWITYANAGAYYIAGASAGAMLKLNTSGYMWTGRIGAGLAQGTNPAVPLHAVSSTGAQLRIAYDDTNYMDFQVDGGGNYIMAPTGDIILNPGGADVRPLVSYATNLGTPTSKFLTVHASEAWYDVMVVQERMVTQGGRWTIGPSTTLTRALAGGSTSYLTITQRGTPTSTHAAGGGGGYNVVTQRGTVTTVTGAGGGQQTITARGSATTGATDSASSVTVNKPTGVVDGDVMLAFVTWWTGSLTPPAGWTQVGTTESWAASSDTAKMAVFRKTASGEGSNYTWTNSSSPNEIYVTIRAFYNVDTTTPIDVVGQNSTTSQGTSVVGNSVTTTTTNTMLMFFGSRMDNGINGNAITPDGSMTEISDLNAGSGWTRHFVDEQAVAATGATGSRTATSTGNATYGAFMVALRAATGGNTSVSSSKPSGVVDGDHMTALVVKEGAGTLTVPGGWTLQDSQAVAGGTAYIYTKTASSEGSSYTWSLNNTSRLSVHCIAHYNLDGTTKLDVAIGKQSNSASTSMTSPTITTVTPETMILHLGAAIDTSAGSATVTPPSGMTEQSDAGGGDSRLHIASVIQSAAGATGAKVSTLTTSEISAGFTMALRPSAVGGGNTSVTVTKPSGVVDNDCLYAAVAQGGGTLTPPAGWTLVGSQAGDNGTLSVYRKIAASEGASYVWSLNNTDSLSVTIGAYYNVNTSTPIDVFSFQANNTASTSMASATVTPTTTAGMLLMIGAAIDTSGGSVTATAPAGMTERADGGAGETMSYVADLLLSSSSATGTKTASLSSSKKSIGAQIVLMPAATGTAPTTMYVKHNNLAVNDWVVMEDVNKLEWLLVTAGPTTISATEYSYTVTRNLDGTGANDWPEGQAMLNTRNAGHGWWEFYSSYGFPREGQTSTQRVGPTMVANVRPAGSATFSQFRERIAAGNLNGLYDYGTNVYGFVTGVPTAAWIGVDDTNGIRFMNNTSTMAKWSTAGAITLGQVANTNARVEMSSGAINFITRNGAGVDTTTISFLSAPAADGSTASFAGVVNVGTNGGIWQGSAGTFLSPQTGLKIYNSGGKGIWESWLSSTKQVFIDPADMKLKAGAGALEFGSTGIVGIVSGSFGWTSGLQFKAAGTLRTWGVTGALETGGPSLIQRFYLRNHTSNNAEPHLAQTFISAEANSDAGGQGASPDAIYIELKATDYLDSSFSTLQIRPTGAYFSAAITALATNAGSLSATDGAIGSLNLGTATGASAGDLRLQSRVEYRTANADGGSWAVLGVNAGASKGLVLYDYHNSRGMLRLTADTRSARFFDAYNSGAILNLGDASVDYPANTGWASTYNANLLLTGLNYTSIGFHDAGVAAHSLRYTNKIFDIGSDLGFGWGTAALWVGGYLRVNKPLYYRGNRSTVMTHNSSGNWLAWTWNVDDVDDYSIGNGSVLTAIAAGAWHICAKVTFVSNATGYRGIAIYDVTNSVYVSVQTIPAVNGAVTHLNISDTIYAASDNQTYEIRVFQNSGGNLDLGSGSPVGSNDRGRVSMFRVP